jgi:hypothetical protein
MINPGFERGDFSGWTLVGDTTGSHVDTVNVHSGLYAAALSSRIGGTLSQTLSTVTGSSYTLSFWLANDGVRGNAFEILWNGTLVAFFS